MRARWLSCATWGSVELCHCLALDFAALTLSITSELMLKLHDLVPDRSILLRAVVRQVQRIESLGKKILVTGLWCADRS